ncbi:MAG: hypothetical protein NC918_00765 [Candidatus Omnitrophica bacterium]|nr:hypothetical protein [Candidatus Omnitrophota bacterium]
MVFLLQYAQPSYINQVQYNFDNFKNAFSKKNSPDEFVNSLQNLKGKFYNDVIKALENKNYIKNGEDNVLNVWLSLPDNEKLNSLKSNPIFKEKLTQLLCLYMFSPSINEDITKKIFNLVYNNDFTNISADDIKSFLNDFLKIDYSYIPNVLSTPYTFAGLLDSIKPTYYKQNFFSGNYNDTRPILEHFFPSFQLLNWLYQNFITSVETFNNTIKNQDFSVSKGNIPNTITIGDCKIDLTEFSKLKVVDNNKISLTQAHWSNLLTTKKKNLKELVNLMKESQYITEDMANTLNSDIDNGKLTENLKIFFNFFGAAAEPLLLGMILDAIFIYQIKNGIKSGIFNFTDESIKNWQDFFVLYLELNDQNNLIDKQKIIKILNNPEFISNDVELENIKKKLDNGDQITEEDLTYLKKHLRKFLPSFYLCSTASGEKIISTQEAQLLEGFRNFLFNHPAKVLSLLNIKVSSDDQVFKENVFNLIAPYSFLNVQVYYISPGTKKENNNILWVNGLYTIDHFIKDFVSVGGEQKLINNKILYTTFNQLNINDMLPTEEQQKKYPIKLGWVDLKNNNIYYGDGSKTLKNIIDQGGTPIYFIESETDLVSLNNFFFKKEDIYNDYTEKVMQKYRGLSSFSIGQSLTEYKIITSNEDKELNKTQYYIKENSYAITLDPKTFQITRIDTNKNTQTNAYSSIILTPIYNMDGEQQPQPTSSHIYTSSDIYNKSINSISIGDFVPQSTSYNISGNKIEINGSTVMGVLYLNPNNEQPGPSRESLVYSSSKYPWGVPIYGPSLDYTVELSIYQPSLEVNVSAQKQGPIYRENPLSIKLEKPKITINNNPVTADTDLKESLYCQIFAFDNQNNIYLLKRQDGSIQLEKLYTKVIDMDNNESFELISIKKLGYLLNNSLFSFKSNTLILSPVIDLIIFDQSGKELGTLSISKTKDTSKQDTFKIELSTNDENFKFKYKDLAPSDSNSDSKGVSINTDRIELNQIKIIWGLNLNEEQYKKLKNLYAPPTAKIKINGIFYDAIIYKNGKVDVFSQGQTFNIGTYNFENGNLKINQDDLNDLLEHHQQKFSNKKNN